MIGAGIGVLAAAAAVILFVTGSAGADSAADKVSSEAGDAGQLLCDASLAGLPLMAGHQGIASSREGAFLLECKYAPAQTAGVAVQKARVTVAWAENDSDATWQNKCGLPEARKRGTVTAEGTLYSGAAFAIAAFSGESKYADPMRRLAVRLLAAAETRAYSCDGAPAPTPAAPSSSQSSPPDRVPVQQATPTPAPAGPATVAPSATCQVSGRVTDVAGSPVPGIHVQLAPGDGLATDDTATGPDGRYQFDAPASPQTAMLRLIPEEYAHTPSRMRVMFGEDEAVLSQPLTGSQTGSLCERNFDMWSLTGAMTSEGPDLKLWPDLVQLYQNFHRAWDLADQVGASLDYGLPLTVHAWCGSKALLCDASGQTEFAFYRGTTDNDPVDRPYIALGHPNSAIGAKGTPDNKEYHEFGHAFFTDFFGNSVPRDSADRNHGGYYNNGTTVDSYVEGFAEFYSMMVSKHVDQDPAAHRYRIGAEYDLEVDHRPWEASGWWEEFTLAGLLLDFEDGGTDYRPALSASALTIHQTKQVATPSGVFATGKVRNGSGATLDNVQVTVRLLAKDGAPVFTQTTAVLPKTLKPGVDGVFYVAAPPGTVFSDIVVEPGAAGTADDDPIDATLKDVLAALQTGPDGRVSSVAELYRALSDYFVGHDRNGDGATDATQPQVDKVFLAHGLFADADGDMRYDPARDGAIGLTSHPARKVGTLSYPAALPRHDAPPVPGSLITVDAGDVPTDAIVQIEYPAGLEYRSYAYVVPAGAESPVEVAAPAEGQGAVITVIALPEGQMPAVALRISGDDFHTRLSEDPARPAIAPTKVESVPGSPFAAGSTGTGGPGSTGTGGTGSASPAGGPDVPGADGGSPDGQPDVQGHIVEPTGEPGGIELAWIIMGAVALGGVIIVIATLGLSSRKRKPKGGGGTGDSTAAGASDSPGDKPATDGTGAKPVAGTSGSRGDKSAADSPSDDAMKPAA